MRLTWTVGRMVFLTFKFLIIGDTEVGKSALLLRFTEQKYRDVQDLTVGVEFGARMIDVDGTEVKLEIWDTAGQEAFLSITRSYYRGADGALLVYDISRRATFQNLTRWLGEARQNSGNDDLKLILVGAKADQGARRQVSAGEAAEFARKHGMVHVETSSKSGLNVDEAFVTVARDIFRAHSVAHKAHAHASGGNGHGAAATGSGGGGGAGRGAGGRGTVNLRLGGRSRGRRSAGGKAGCCN